MVEADFDEPEKLRQLFAGDLRSTFSGSQETTAPGAGKFVPTGYALVGLIDDGPWDVRYFIPLLEIFNLPCPTFVGNHEDDMTCGPTILMPQVFLGGDLVWELLPTSFADHKLGDGIKCVVLRSTLWPHPHQVIRHLLQRAMFSNSSYLVAFLVASFSFGAHAATVKPSLSARQAAIASTSSSFSETSSFESSWQSLSQSFAQTQSVCQQQASFSVVYESVQTLYQTYQTAFNQYQSCSMCNTALAQSGFQTQFQQSSTVYGSQYQSQLLPIFQQMSSFGSFTQTIATSLSVDLKAILGGIGLQVDLFANIGLDLGGILGGSSGGGLLSGVLGGGHKSGGLLTGLLG
ncbi:hypothetical protein H4Q26_000175 [Puccinia striiformis f. sp. tritici PST-130]|nr:hypothetical protein H4Q26_000175 [Puccinia striiformis f. sp. tritici PST-130]